MSKTIPAQMAEIINSDNNFLRLLADISNTGENADFTRDRQFLENWTVFKYLVSLVDNILKSGGAEKDITVLRWYFETNEINF